MKSGEYLQHDAVGLAELVARGETNAGELLELALGQSAKAQPKTNAICLMMESEARSQLKKQLTGPFAGVPFLIKDCAQDYAGLLVPLEGEDLAPGADHRAAVGQCRQRDRQQT